MRVAACGRGAWVCLVAWLCCSFKDWEQCYSAAKTVFFLGKQETQSSSSERVGRRFWRVLYSSDAALGQLPRWPAKSRVKQQYPEVSWGTEGSGVSLALEGYKSTDDGWEGAGLVQALPCP